MMTRMGHTALMRVDVITAVHAAHARFLPFAWASLRAQSYPDWTWLVQLDGPQAEAWDALSRCGAAGEPRVRVAAHGTHEGPAVTRNIALGGASAPLVHSLDADDEFEPDALALLVTALQTHPAAGFAVGPSGTCSSPASSANTPYRYPLAPCPEASCSPSGRPPRGSIGCRCTQPESCGGVRCCCPSGPGLPCTAWRTPAL
jgi:cellulose synthase/poly-beta-1,6-N-acetylglucosamine synthase-like glycosyltransferase